MTMPWLFGEEQQMQSLGSYWRLQPRTFDIDVVTALYRLLAAKVGQDVDAWDASYDGARPLPGVIANQRQDVANRHPQITLVSFAMGIPTEPEVIPVDEVVKLNAYDRSRIRLTGAGITVMFDSSELPVVTSDANADTRLVHQVVELLRSEGRRRPQRGSVIALGLLLIAAVITALGVWAIVDSGARLSACILIGVLLVGVWVAAIWSAIVIARKSRTVSPREGRILRFTGNAFREGSLSDVRARIANARATTLVSLVTVPVGAILGWFLNQWLG